MRTALSTATRLASTHLAATGFVLVLTTMAAQATVHVAIDLTHQRMHVDGNEGAYDWPVSSARSGFSTPGGSYAPTHMELMHYSRKYHMSPMPHAIFFRGGYAIHGTDATGSLGRPASHGCVRLSPGNAARLYAMVKAEGARISISGAPPASRRFRAREENRDPARATPGRMSGASPRGRRRIARRPYVGYGYDEAQAYGYGAGPRWYYGYRPNYTYAPGAVSAPWVQGGSSRQRMPLFPFDGE